MGGRIVGLFSHSSLSLSASFPPGARDAAGRIRAWDEPTGRIELEDGSTYCLPEDLAATALRPGTEVHLLYVRAEPATVCRSA